MKSTSRKTAPWVAFLVLGGLAVFGPVLAQAQEPRGTRDKEVRIRISGDRRATELTLASPVQPDRIAGTFQRGAIGVQFSSVRTQAGISFVLRALDGTELYSLTETREYVENQLLGGRLQHRADVALLDLFESRSGEKGGIHLGSIGAFIAGDQRVASEFLARPELALLPRLSQILGEELGYTGISHPATLPLHLMARNMSKQGIGRITPAPPIVGFKCESYPNAENECFGMCGKGCSCWWWICGDCCQHGGCETHDATCRPGEDQSWYYCNVEFWTPFTKGGGCGQE